jgi:hypothetical protein
MNRKEFIRKQSWHILRYNPGIRVEGLRKITITLSWDSRSPGRDLNPEPSEYEAPLDYDVRSVILENPLS